MSVNVANIYDPDEGHSVRFISWNVKGLNGSVKRATVFSHLKQLKPDILLLQETHLRLEDHNRLRRNWISQIFCSFISTNINTFLTINETDSVSYSVLWETLKAYLRGLI